MLLQCIGRLGHIRTWSTARRERVLPSGRPMRPRFPSFAMPTAGNRAATGCMAAIRASGQASSPASAMATSYKYVLRTRDGRNLEKSDPSRFMRRFRRSRLPSSSNCPNFPGRTAAGCGSGRRPIGSNSPSRSTRCISASWKRPTDGRRYFNYRELAHMLVDYCPRDGLHAPAAHADLRVSVRRLLGLPDDGLLRPDQPPRHAERLHVLRRLLPPGERRRADGLGPRPLSLRWPRTGALRRHGPVRARGPAARHAPRLGHVHLQLRTQRSPRVLDVERPLLARRLSRRRDPRRRRRLHAVPRLFAARPGNGSPINTAAAKTSRRSSSSRISTSTCTGPSPAS